MFVGLIIVDFDGFVIVWVIGEGDELILVECDFDKCVFGKFIVFNFVVYWCIEYYGWIINQIGVRIEVQDE